MFARNLAIRALTTSRSAVGASLRSAGHLNVPKAAAFKQAVARTFSAGPFRMSAMSDVELTEVLSKEIEYEKENPMQSGSEFLEGLEKCASSFTIHDKPGDNEIVLTREFGSDKITVTFSIDDVANVEPVDGSDEVSLPVATVITVHKPKHPEVGAISFQAIADGASFQITNVTHTSDSALALADNAEADYHRRGQYVGPIFEELDDGLTTALYDYLNARGVDSQLAEFIPSYVEYKEQREYIRWLEQVKKFVDRK